MLYGIIGLFLGMLLIYLWVRPRLKEKIKLNEDLKAQNATIEKENLQFTFEQKTLKESLTSLHQEEARLNNLIQTLQNTKKFQEDNLTNDYNDKVHLLDLKFQQLEKEYLEDYYNIMSESAQQCSVQGRKNKETIEELTLQMNTLKSAVQSAQAEVKRVQEEAQQEQFYKLQLNDIDLQEAEIIKSVAPRLRDALPLNKIIWSSYYRPAFNALRSRVLCDESKTGIYKLVNNIDGKVYIGQAKDIGARWSEHIKAGLGASAGPNNKLYTTMKEVGPHNFSFILLEECPIEQLNEKERFWIDFYDSKTNGLNENGGIGE